MVLAIAGVALAFLSESGACSRQVGNGGKSMTNLKLNRFYTAKTLLDLTSAAYADTAYLVTIDHLYQAAGGSGGISREKTAWRFWSCVEASKGFRQSSETVVALPPSTTVSAVLSGTKLTVLLESNQEHAAFLGIWRLATHRPVQLSESSPAAVPIDLAETQAEQVHIDLRQEWSTAKLLPRNWLFNPSVISPPGQDDVMVTMNTADAHAVVWRSSGITLLKQPLAFVPDALEPVVVAIGSKILLLYRKPTPQWSVYFHASRFSGAYGPVALPLILAELGPDGHVLHSRDLSKESGLGDVIAFSASGDLKRGLMLATIAGSKESPKLRLHLSSDLGYTLQETGVAILPAIPYRLSATMSETVALVGLVYKEAEGYQVDGACLSLDR